MPDLTCYGEFQVATILRALLGLDAGGRGRWLGRQKGSEMAHVTVPSCLASNKAGSHVLMPHVTMHVPQLLGMRRFKYRQVPATSFGLSLADILTHDDKELNQVCDISYMPCEMCDTDHCLDPSWHHLWSNMRPLAAALGTEARSGTEKGLPGACAPLATASKFSAALLVALSGEEFSWVGARATGPGTSLPGDPLQAQQLVLLCCCNTSIAAASCHVHGVTHRVCHPTKRHTQVAGLKRLAPYRDDGELPKTQRPNYKALQALKGSSGQQGGCSPGVWAHVAWAMCVICECLAEHVPCCVRLWRSMLCRSQVHMMLMPSRTSGGRGWIGCWVALTTCSMCWSACATACQYSVH